MVSTVVVLCIAVSCLLPSVQLDDSTCSSEGCEKDLIRMFRGGCPITHSDVQCAVRKIEQIHEWLNKNNDFRILITGKMGTGKTTLVKGLKDNFVPDEDHLEPHTKKVTPYSWQHIDKINFTFFDTPGLKDTVKGSNDYSYLKEMVEKNEQPDLVIFALKMDDAQFRKEDIGAIGNITDAFGWKIWKNAMFVLTFANKVSKPGVAPDSRENKAYFSEMKYKFSVDVTKLLRKHHVQEEVANNIPVIPVGLFSQPIIEADEHGEPWVDEFWKNLYKVLKRFKQIEQKESSSKGNSEVAPKSSSPWWCFWPLC